MSTNIKQLREEKHINQQEIADQIGTTRQTFSKMENGQVEPTL